MQLFITNEFEVRGNNLIVKEKRIFDQLRKVLRARPGYKFAIQPLVYPKKKFVITRHFLVFENFDDWFINAKIEKIEQVSLKPVLNGVATAILNKIDKMEFIAQKLTELWIENIIFWPSKRSVVKQISENKLKRLNKIMLEAAEQSWNLFVPNLIVLKNLEEIFNIWFSNYFLADFGGQKLNCKIEWKSNIFIVGPEGGFEDAEKNFLYNKCKVVSLWTNILRAETASVICGWLLV